MKFLPLCIYCDEVWPVYFVVDESHFAPNCEIPEPIFEEYKKVRDDFERFQQILKEYYQKTGECGDGCG